MVKKNVELKVQDEPYFTCDKCGYQDYMGNNSVCPICDPEEHKDQDVCFFVDLERGLCRQDGLTCDHIEEKSWDECPKLEGLGKKK